VTPVDRNLLLRIARRLEEQADAAWRASATAANDTKTLDQIKRRRDRELGDAKDLREFVKRAETTT
jgi:hypothetical protein